MHTFLWGVGRGGLRLDPLREPYRREAHSGEARSSEPDGEGRREGRLERRVGRALEGYGELADAVGFPGEGERWCVDELDRLSSCGFLFRVPGMAGAAEVAVHSTERFVVLVFGNLQGKTAAESAREIARRFVSYDQQLAGALSVAHLEGSFGVAVVDRSEPSVWLISDLVGHRALRYWQSEDGFFVSPHDLCFAATGALDLVLDTTAVASVVTLQWSLGGASFFEGVAAAHADEVVRWTPGGIEASSSSLIDLQLRLDPGDREGVDVRVRQLAADMPRGIAALVESGCSATVTLTAGLDSRALLGAAVASLDRHRLSGLTFGPPNCQDVQIAYRLSELAGIEFNSSTPARVDRERFLHQVEIGGALMNGDTCADRMAFLNEVGPPSSVAKIGGQGGEVFRGVCYPAGALPADSHACMNEIASRRPRVATARFRSPELNAAVRHRLHLVFESYWQQSSSTADHLDLFYLLERVGRWGAEAGRLPWLGSLVQPYQGKEFIRQAFRLPAGEGAREPIHHRLLSDLLPGARWLPVNGQRLLPLRAYPAVDSTYRFVHRAKRGLHRRWVGPKRFDRTLGLEAVAGRRIGRLLEQEQLRDRLESEGSVSREIFSSGELARWIDAHLSGTARHELPLGSLLTLESFWQTAESLVSAARSRSEEPSAPFEPLPRRPS